MIVFDLRCGDGHVFEAWFASSNAFQEQREASLVRCPWCDSGDVEKAVMAPNLASKGNRSTPTPPARMKEALGELARLQTEALRDSEWVGTDFAKRARAIHDGTADRATIHGQATPAQARALADDGIAVLPLPFPVVPPTERN